MKLITYIDRNATPRAGAVLEGRVIDLTAEIASLPLSTASREFGARTGTTLPTEGMLRLLHAGPDALSRIATHVESVRHGNALKTCPSIKDTRLLAPIPRPGKIVAIGRNYADHARETGVKPFEKPRIIGKFPSSVIAPGKPVRIPPSVAKLDFEVELAVVIGSFASRVSRAEAMSAIAGYTILNDLSAREFQFDLSPPQTTFAKSMDGFTPLGPWIVTSDEIPDPRDLRVSCQLNGTLMQEGNTSDLLFPVDVLIEYVSRFMTLEPGDIIATGTPAGSGAFRSPPVYLKSGDRLRLEIERIGIMEHEIVSP